MGRQISQMEPSAVFPLCNVGSSTEHFRKRGQPWIDEHIFRPLEERGLSVVHVDAKGGPGVDLVGDLSDHRFLKELSEMDFKSVLCSNLLEHLPNRQEVARVLTSIVPLGGFLFVSCPFRYPFHADPIDTMFRPDVKGIAAVFPGATVVSGEIVTGGTYWDYLTRSPSEFLVSAIRLLLPFYKPIGWLSLVGHLPWMGRNFQATCVVLRKAVEVK